MKNIPYYPVRKIQNLKEMLYTSCDIFENRVAYYYKDEGKYKEIKYKQVRKDVDSLGTALINLSLKGKKIAVIGENRYEWAISYLSVICGTGIIVPLDRQLLENEILNCIKRANVSAIIYSKKIEPRIKNIAKDLSMDFFICMDSDGEKVDENFLILPELLQKGEKLLESKNTQFVNAKINNEEMSVILFTSGTTSESKAIMLSHKNICFNLENQCKMLNVTENDIFLSILPLHHTYECTCGFLDPLYRGAAVAYCEGIRHIQKNMKESHASFVLSVPIVFELIYKRIWQSIEEQGKAKLVKFMIKVTNLLDKVGIHIKKKVFKEIHDQLGGNIKIFIAGAASIEPKVAKGYRDLGFLAVQGYGLSECAPIAALNRDVDYKDEAVGLPLVNSEIKINNPNEEGVGEILIKGDHVMLGYYEDEKATKEGLKDGWLYTGDLGYIDSDGFVYIAGRQKNVIITKNGKNVYPEEIEILLNKNEYIKESMVYAKKEDKDVVIVAKVLLDKEYIEEKFKDNPKTDEEIYKIVWDEVKEINKNLVIYKHIKSIEIKEGEFEKTTTLKIKRYKEVKE